MMMSHDDLRDGVGGSTRPEDFFESGNSEWREVNVQNLKFVLEKVRSGAPDADALMQKFAADSLGWVKGQVFFGFTQRNAFEKSLAENEQLNSSSKTEELKTYIRRQFSHFNDNIWASHERYEHMARAFAAEKDTERRFKMMLGELGWDTEKLMPEMRKAA